LFLQPSASSYVWQDLQLFFSSRAFCIPCFIESDSGSTENIELLVISSTPLLVATTGVPDSSASVIVNPKGSLIEGETNTSAAP